MLWWKNADLKWLAIGFLILQGTLTKAQPGSVLSTGQWLKIGIKTSGVYKIDAALLRKMGWNTTTLDPRKLKLYGNGGALLPQANSAPRPTDLIQNPVWIDGEQDGKWDEKDALYFYAEGPTTIQTDSTKQLLSHQTHFYSNSNYYFLTIGSQNGLRIQEEPFVVDADATVISEFDDYWYHENETTNLLQSGRSWWGEYLGGASALSIPLPITAPVPNSQARLRLRAIASAQVVTKLIPAINGQIIGEQSFGTVTTAQYDTKAVVSEKDYHFTIGSPTTLTIAFDKNGQNSAGAYLDFAAIQTKRSLQAPSDQQIFHFLPGASSSVEYRIKNTPPTFRLWNITNPLTVKASGFRRNADGIASIVAHDGLNYRCYIGFLPSTTKTPEWVSVLPNQNLRQSVTPDLLIVTSAELERQAYLLANFRQQEGLDVLVVTQEQIFNEFSSGKTDVSALRDFVRYLYQSDQSKLKYLLLFGDATYDYKNLRESTAGTLPTVSTYESIESLNPVYTYSSDDYFGFLDEEEGEWQESPSGDHILDIGVGRLPVKSAEEAQIVVEKLIHYTSSSTRGSWLNRVSFVADDGDDNIHQQHADILASQIESATLPARLFLDAFPQTTTPEGQKVPLLNSAIRKSIEEGSLILNYTGHGGISGWAEEQVLTLSDMFSVRGYNTMPLLITATCEFGRYDNPSLVSGAELMVLSPKGAAIGALTTTRPVYSSTNFALNQAFYSAFLEKGPSVRLGDLMLLTKNSSLKGSLNRNFVLLGDPSMRLARPLHTVRWEMQPDTLRSLKKVTLTGLITTEGGLPVSNFNGTAQISVLDKPLEFKTLGNQSESQTFQEYRNKLFEGVVTVSNGRFSVEFVVPRDIDYRIGAGRVSIYALSSDSLSEAAGQLAVTIGGSLNTPLNNNAPTLSAYLNDTNFKDGDGVSPDAVLWVDIRSENGINLSQTGLGHGLTAYLNDTISYDLSPYYVTNKDDYQSGKIRFQLEHLPLGDYVMRIKAWDTHTNSAETTFRFRVQKQEGIKFLESTIYPNPFRDELSFEMVHSRENDDLEMELKIVDVTGLTLLTSKKTYYNSSSKLRESLSSDDLRKFPQTSPAIYLYEVVIRSTRDGSTQRKTGKIIHVP
jgi:hypothetical protein